MGRLWQSSLHNSQISINNQCKLIFPTRSDRRRVFEGEHPVTARRPADLTCVTWAEATSRSQLNDLLFRPSKIVFCHRTVRTLLGDEQMTRSSRRLVLNMTLMNEPSCWHLISSRLMTQSPLQPVTTHIIAPAFKTATSTLHNLSAAENGTSSRKVVVHFSDTKTPSTRMLWLNTQLVSL